MKSNETMMGMTNPETVHYGLWDGSSIVVCAYILTLLLITIKRREYPNVFMLFVPASVLLLVVLYCPGVYNHLPYTDTNDHRQVFRRIRWLFMLLPTLSFGLTYIYVRAREIAKIQIAAVIILLAIVSVFYTSDGQEEYGFWDRSGVQDHLYKVPHTVITMGDLIWQKDGEFLSEDKDNVVTLLVCDSGQGKWEKSIRHQAQLLRLYVSPVRWVESSMPTGKLNNSNSMGKYDYVLCANDESVIRLFENAGYKSILTMDGVCFLTKRDNT